MWQTLAVLINRGAEFRKGCGSSQKPSPSLSPKGKITHQTAYHAITLCTLSVVNLQYASLLSFALFLVLCPFWNRSSYASGWEKGMTQFWMLRELAPHYSNFFEESKKGAVNSVGIKIIISLLHEYICAMREKFTMQNNVNFTYYGCCAGIRR